MSFKLMPVFFKNAVEAEGALEQMREIISLYGVVTAEEYYNLSDVKCPIDADKYGWVNLNAAYVVDNGSQSHIILQRPLFIGTEEDTELDSLVGGYEPDMVNHPPHYQSETGLETIDIIAAVTFDLKGIEAVDTGNVVKYISRWKKKNGLQDLEKAKWYLEHLINHVKNLEE